MIFFVSLTINYKDASALAYLPDPLKTISALKVVLEHLYR